MVMLTHGAASTDGNYNSIMIDDVTVTVEDNAAAGICGRTPEVRDALLAQTPGVSDCAAVTAAHLAAITGTLDVYNQSITALAAGDFDGLTSLDTLHLDHNELTTLPDDVFDRLTSLEVLLLFSNELTTLPDGVFEPLTALKLLYLDSNGLTTLPDGVFNGLISLQVLRLVDNPVALFAPTADALPDDGTVPVAGGTVRLDGGGSGGPWGTNVTYRWALTTPASGVTVMFDDDASAMPVVTIPELAADTELTFTLTVTGFGHVGSGTVAGTDTAKVTATATGAEPMARAARSNSAATGAPTISGTAQVGKTLTADTSGISDTDGLSGATYSYQWLADDVAIQGATDSSYTLASSDAGKAMKVKVSFTDDAGNAESLTSVATKPRST